MITRIDKWYFDFSSNTSIGYYYIIKVQIGQFHFGATGIYHFDDNSAYRSFKFSKLLSASNHDIVLSNALMSLNSNQSYLKIDHSNVQLEGTWKFESPVLKRIYKPLLNNNLGWCDWKVWSPLSNVALSITNPSNKVFLQGTGYIDYVRFAFPFWKIPITALYWGRLHCDNSWIVLFTCKTREKTVSLYYSPEKIREDISLDVTRSEQGEITSFNWQIGLIKEKDFMRVKTVKCLEDQMILDTRPLSNFILKSMINRISSNGYDRKYAVSLQVGNKYYKGIMEEVTWDER